MIAVEFHDQGEIRMGSPYHRYNITLEGEWVPDLQESDWQNTHAKSPDGRYLVLTSWDAKGNRPGFYFVLIDAAQRSWLRTGVFGGCCTKVEWKDDLILWEAWSIEGERSGKLELPKAPRPGTARSPGFNSSPLSSEGR